MYSMLLSCLLIPSPTLTMPPALIKLFVLPEKKLHEETDLHDLLGKKDYSAAGQVPDMVCMAPDIQTTMPLQLKK